MYKMASCSLMINLLSRRLVGGLVTLCSQYSFVVENDEGVCGYVLASEDAKEFHGKMALSWLPEMQKKYPVPVETDSTTLTRVQVNVDFIVCQLIVVSIRASV